MPALKRYLASENVSDAEFGAAIGSSRMAVFRWRRGLNRPNDPTKIKIARETKGAVMPNDWFPELAEYCGDTP